MATLTVARELIDEGSARDAVLVVILPDGGRSYLSKLYNDEWMRANGLLVSAGAAARVRELLGDRHREGGLPDLVVARTTDQVGRAIDILQTYGISQMPVSEAPVGSDLAGLVGSITEKDLLDRAFRNPAIVERTVGEVMGPPLPKVTDTASLDEAFALLSGGAAAVLAVRDGTPIGVVTKLDLLEYVAHHRLATG